MQDRDYQSLAEKVRILESNVRELQKQLHQAYKRIDELVNER